MSEASKAVFLSYASQDADAAKRIADALRATGVEVWFDQSELVGGDAWDQKIRRQIKECALLIPIISANTQAREEGYFRIEWELAAQRALGIASGVAFILPIVIDDTKEPAALVPDRFRTVQWTKLPGGVVPPEVLQRFLKLWSHRTGVVKNSAGSPVGAALRRAGLEESRPHAAPTKRPAWPWVALGLVALGITAFVILGRKTPAPSAPAIPPAPAISAVQADAFPRDPELRRVRQLLFSLDSIPEDFRLAEDLLKPVLAQQPNDPETVTVAAELNQEFLSRGFDNSPVRRAQTQRLAERAVLLAPDNPYAQAVMARYLLFIGGQLARAEELVRKAISLRPDEARFHRNLHYILFLTRPAAETDAYGERMAAQFPRDPLVTYDIGRRFKDSNDLVQMEQWFDRTLERDPAIAFAMIWKAWLAVWVHGDLDEMKQWIDRVPERQRSNTRVVNARYVHALFSGETRTALRALNELTDEWLTDFDLTVPKTLLAGNLAQLEGRSDLARVQFEAALTTVNAELEKTPNDVRPLRAKLWVLIGLGRVEEARGLQRVFLQSLTRPYLTNITRINWANPIISCLLLDFRTDALSLLRDSSGEANCRRVLRSLFKLDPRLKPWRDDAEINALLAEPKMETAATPSSLSTPPDAKSVAVLAFANLSDDKNNEYFSDGISEELLNVLAKIPGLKVSARTSAFYFKGKEVPIPEIARQLGVAYVVEGSVRKQGDKVRITAQLIKAADGFHVWSDTFTRDLKDIFAVQDEIAGLIAKNLSLRLGTDRPTSGRATVPEAFELYVQGRAAWNLRTREGYTQAENLLKRAIDLDPGFARAHSALADVWSIAGYENESGGGTYGWRNSPTLAKIAAKAEQAVALDANCAESLTSLASALEFGWKWGEAERAYRRAIELNPNYATARHWFGMMLWVQGKMDDALAQLKRATENDPLSHRILDTHARMLNQAGRPEEALAVAERALALQPLAIQAATQKAHALVLLGRSNEAVTLLEKALAHGANTEQRTNALLILHLAGADAAMRRLVGATEELPASQFRFASLIALGRTDEALAELRPENLHEFQLINMAVMSFYDPVRENPRFLQAISEVGYLEYYRRARAWLTANLPKVKK